MHKIIGLHFLLAITFGKQCTAQTGSCKLLAVLALLTVDKIVRMWLFNLEDNFLIARTISDTVAMRIMHAIVLRKKLLEINIRDRHSLNQIIPSVYYDLK